MVGSPGNEHKSLSRDCRIIEQKAEAEILGSAGIEGQTAYIQQGDPREVLEAKMGF